MYENIDPKQAIATLKPDLSYEKSRAIVLSHDNSPVLKNLGNGLLVAYLVDAGDCFVHVLNRHLNAHGLDEVALHRIGISNLHDIAQKHLRVEQYGAVYGLFMESNFEASVLLLDTVWDVSLANLVREDFLAVVPTRDVLAFGDSGSPQAVAELHGVVDRLKASNDHPISTSLYRRKNGKWLSWNV